MQRSLLTLVIGLTLLTPPLVSGQSLGLDAQIQALIVRIESLQKQIADMRANGVVLGTAATCPTLSRTLVRSTWGEDVRQLQSFLIEQKFLPAGNETSYFGFATEGAVKKFQCTHKIVCSGSPYTTGYGAVGPATREKIQAICSAPPVVVQPVATTTPTSPSPTATTTSPSPTFSSCTFGSSVIAHGSSVTAYQSASVPAGTSCSLETRTCVNGVLSGTYTSSSCVVGTAGLSATQRQRIISDLALIKSWGYGLVRIITFAKVNDPAYSTWPNSVFFSFPQPTEAELTNFKEYLRLIDTAGLQYEVVLLMPDSKGLYYQNGVTTEDYKKYVDALWNSMWVGKLNKIFVGGDLSLGIINSSSDPYKLPQGSIAVESHRRWISEMWPYMNQKCSNCLGIAFYSAHASFHDNAVGGIQWVKSNLNPQPAYLGVQFYPSAPSAMRSLGFTKTDGSYDWRRATQDWVSTVVGAAKGTPVFVDEVGLDLSQGFSAADQASFFAESLAVFNENALPFNVWEYADHPGIGLFGLMDTTRTIRPAVQNMLPYVAASRDAGRLPGMQYIPPESVGQQFIDPEGF